MKHMLSIALSLAFAVAAVAQPAGAGYWDKPGEVIRDASGTIIYQEIKDPKTFTTRVYDHGNWVKYYYVANTTKVSRVEAADTTEDYLYNGDDWNGLSVRLPAGSTYTLRSSAGIVSASGMAPVTILHDDTYGRDYGIRYGNSTVVSVDYGDAGEIDRISIGGIVLAVTYGATGVTETLTSPAGAVITSRTVSPSAVPHLSRGALSLDAVAGSLGLGADWFNQIKTRRSVTGSLITAVNQKQVRVLNAVEFGDQRAAWDGADHPLFCDVRLQYNDVGGKVLPYLGILPTRFVITPAGDVAAYVVDPDQGTISAIWTSSVNGHPTYNYRLSHSGNSRSALARPTSTAVPDAKRADGVGGRDRMNTPVAALMMWICGTQEVWSCYDYSGGSYCENSYYPEYCDGGSGTTTVDSGGGGGTPAGNQITGNTQLRFMVGVALTSAANKLANTQCGQQLFQDMLMDDGTPVSNVLTQKGVGSSAWLNNITWLNGAAVKDPTGAVPCNNTAILAWMNPPGSTVDYVCSGFSNLTSSYAADMLIHEELHSLGLPEYPQDPNAKYTAAQITQAVINHCGS